MTDLTKWPRLLVAGDPVTREQANEILIRTDDWCMTVNDRAWNAAVTSLAAEYGMPIEPPFGVDIEVRKASWQAMKAWRKRIGVLQLHYLDNARIGSPWIGGPKGWCDWDGRIGCSTYNIGKWPTVEELTADWEIIAAAFPFLKLHAQVVTHEGEDEVAATWAVMGGRAALVEPVGKVARIEQLESADIIARLGPGGERGVTLERLREALEQVAKAAL
ncbi:hypothetical protein [Nonomuraea cavernae]|uniref:Uncharacterized protein n=1 Tax=Nonomuraea cavernae TaxID=2045107 RepID=A0A918DF18_9ACTN|nr:hypothetical protein [Nonomuraea cavernae]MCA2184711.1 hypothetical protein [Nonomuraea cavernae]GGO62987.1 hypothetical protein GCM10012289_08850 [Nonomuraea cavernae]